MLRRYFQGCTNLPEKRTFLVGNIVVRKYVDLEGMKEGGHLEYSRAQNFVINADDIAQTETIFRALPVSNNSG
jgi:hypothetical protein